MSNCSACGILVGSHEGVHVGNMDDGYRFMCSRCHNMSVAEYLGLGYEHIAFEPVTLEDALGRPHTFKFRTHIFSDQLSMDAIEDVEDGYEFQVIADAEQDLFVTFQKLFERMRRELARQHLEAHGEGYQIKDWVLRGQIDSEVGDSGKPLFIIDGIPFTLEELGELVSPFMGFRFKLELFDLSEEK
ncbi:DUF4178 domain-containing protein [Gammaproteobacteria bacterium]